MEGLHVAMEDAKASNLYCGISLRMGNLRPSHLFYADDVLFLGDWSQRNVKNLVILLHFFFMASGWKVTTLSIGGRSMLLKTVLGSLGIYFLFMFVMPVGVAKQLESMRSHFFWGRNSDQRKMAWVSWDSVMASYSRGGRLILEV
ncbi:hypothetical protein Tco_1501537 [Tanacetum coccineum]